MAQDWDIKTRADCCSHCRAAFEDRQMCVSALTHGPEGYARGDYHDGCWGAAAAALSPFSVWRGVFHAPPPPAEEPVKKETAETLLRKLMEQDDPGQTNVIYILAVMMERKRIFVERGVERKDDGATVRIYEHRKTKETFLIPEPFLRLDQLQDVQTQVVAMLGGPEGSGPPAPAPDAGEQGGGAAAGPDPAAAATATQAGSA